MHLVLRTETFAKLFFFVSCTGLFLYATLAFYTFHTAYTMVQMPKSLDMKEISPDEDYNYINFDRDLKYILFWTHSDDAAKNIPEGQQIFTDHRCDYSNCFITSNKTMLKDYKNFHAIVFNISVVKEWKRINLPQSRSPKQKYVFYSLEPSDDNPVCNVNADNYFNWTWTYKLNSDIVSPFIEVTDLQGNVVAPKLNVKWMNNVTFVKDEGIDKIKPKRKAMAWIDTCKARKNKAAFAKQLQGELRYNFLDFDIYGCGNLECPKEGCLKEIDRNYHFYLAYEDSIAEDYVTKEVIKAYHHNAVPVVLGGADYRKFLPDGSYIKARVDSAERLAAKIEYIIRNPITYHRYFRWKNGYSIHESEDFKGICDICANLNEEEKFNSFSVYKEFRKWWYSGALYDRCIPRGAEDLAEVLAYINSSVHLI